MIRNSLARDWRLFRASARQKAVGFCGRLGLAEKKKRGHLGSIVVECSVLGDAKAGKPKAKRTEKAEAQSCKPKSASNTKDYKPKLTIGRLVEELLMHETLDYTTIVDRVIAEFPDAKTTPRSVASVAAVLRRNRTMVPNRHRTKG